MILPNHIHSLLQTNTDTDGRPMAAPTILTVINPAKAKMGSAGRDSLPLRLWRKVRKRWNPAHRPTAHWAVGLKFSSPTRRIKKADTHLGICFFGTPEGTRTPNPRNRNPMLYPLSHRRIWFCSDIIAGFSPFVKGKLEKIFWNFPAVSGESGCFPGIPVV